MVRSSVGGEGASGRRAVGEAEEEKQGKRSQRRRAASRHFDLDFLLKLGTLGWAVRGREEKRRAELYAAKLVCY